MILTDPEYNKPKQSICAKCGKSFIHSPWSGAYSTDNSYRFPYAQENYLVTLCDDCARVELNLGHIRRILF